MKKIATIALLALMAAAATAQKSSLTVSLANAPEGRLLLLCEPQGGRLVPVDTLTPDRKGRYRVERNGQQPQFMALVLNVEQQTPIVHVLLLPGEKVTLDLGYRHDLGFMTVENTKGSANMALYAQYSAMVTAAMGDSERQAHFAEGLDSLLRANKGQLMSAFLVTFFEQAFDSYATLYKEVRDALKPTYPDHDFVRHLDDKLRGLVTEGMEAPDIALPDAGGTVRRLSDLRGRVVLIDFWASWCRPCRMENPNVVRLYKEYHDKGFEIYSVSLDNNREKWLQAIEADGLEWPNHVSDLRGWNSAGGRLYGITSIPATVLVGKDGTVLARNLRGAELENALKKILQQ